MVDTKLDITIENDREKATDILEEMRDEFDHPRDIEHCVREAIDRYEDPLCCYDHTQEFIKALREKIDEECPHLKDDLERYEAALNAWGIGGC